MSHTVIAPGGTIGIIGGGQLGRMIALAAAPLGYRCHIFCPDPDSPAAQVANTATVAAYTDAEALKKFAAAVDVVTFEFENIPASSVELLAGVRPVRPGWRALHISQNRVREKDFIRSLGIGTAPYRAVRSFTDLQTAVSELGRPSVLKTTELGYDGKGQIKIDDSTDLRNAHARMQGSEAILEGFIAFEREISVIVARGADGTLASYCPVENRHAHHILDVTLAPAPISPHLSEDAIAIAEKIAVGLDYIGILAVEMFVDPNGALLVNEMAPRPHNSGHWTVDACLCSQFDQAVRAAAGIPLGDPNHHSDAEMRNLLGDDIHDWAALLTEPNSRLHLYGKAQARPGRKMGHITRLKSRSLDYGLRR